MTYIGKIPVGYDHLTLLSYLNEHLTSCEKTVSRKFLKALNALQHFDEIKVIQKDTNQFVFQVQRKNPLLLVNFEKVLFEDSSLVAIGPIPPQDIINLQTVSLSKKNHRLIYDIIQFLNMHQVSLESIHMPSCWDMEIITKKGLHVRFDCNIDLAQIKKILKEALLDPHEYKLIDARYEKGFAFTMKSHPSAKI